MSGAKHNCTIPADKSGHHVILAIWTVGDTVAAFYNAADVNILAEAELPGGWTSVGSIAPSTALLVGDKVKARAFTANGESPDYSVEVSIDNAEEARRKTGRSSWQKKSTRPTPSFAPVSVMRAAMSSRSKAPTVSTHKKKAA